MMDLSRLSGTTALVTGASRGIGAEFATELARRGADVVLVARSADKLAELASSLRSAHGVRALPVSMDLSEQDASRQLFEHTTERGLEVGFLVNNAAAGVVGDTAKAAPASVAAMLNLNALAIVDTTIRYLPKMVARGDGVVVNVTSAGAYFPVPHMAAYAASKAMVHSFTLATSAEVADAGVRMLSLAPGVTATGMKSEDILPSAGGIRTPVQVVATAFRALDAKKPSAVDGRRNTLFLRALRHLPERATVSVAARIARKAAE